jgi:hypothetical protein
MIRDVHCGSLEEDLDFFPIPDLEVKEHWILDPQHWFVTLV